MNDLQAQYDQLDDFYELAYGEDVPGPDIHLYRELAREHGSTVLEMGSGTGRVCTVLASEGMDITGVELSARMLEQAERRAKDKLTSAQVRSLTLLRGNMCSICLPRKFGLVIFPYSSLLEVGTREHVFKAVANAYNLLAGSGVMVIDSFYYGPGGSRRENGIVRERRRCELADGRMARFSETDYYGGTTGATERWLYVDISDHRGIVVDRKTFVIHRIYVPPDGMRELLLSAGFEEKNIALYGAFDGTTPIDDPSFQDETNQNYLRARQVWMCRKP